MRIVKASVTALLLMLLLGYPSIDTNSQSKSRIVIPATPAGQRLAEFLRAYNTGDLSVVRRFVGENFDKTALEKRPANERASANVATFKLTRQLNLHSVERSTDFELEALCQSQVTEAWFSITIQVASQAPHGIIRQSFGFATRPANAIPRGRLNRAQIIKELNAYVAKLVAADMLSGAVLVARNGRPIFKRAYGLDDSRMAYRIETKFDLASMSKMFTSVAIAQLVQQGKLSYDETIGKFLPDYPNRQAAEKVTLHQLLTHTSGIADFLDRQEYQAARHGGKRTFRTMQDWFPFFASDPLSFEPGAKNDYSNGNFVVAGAIIEKITGQSYFDYVREHIFKPAGMGNTIFTVENGNSSGGGLSTVGDLLKFDIALRQHKLLSAKFTDIILTPKVDTGEGEAYGYGFEISQVNGKRIVGHSGGTAEVDNKFEIYLDDGYTVIALTKPHASKNVTRKLKELITQGN